MNSQIHRIGVIIKIIANNPGISLTSLMKELPKSGITVSEKIITKDIESLKRDFALLPNKPRLTGYTLESITTIGSDEFPTIVDALHGFGLTLEESSAYDISERLLSLRCERQASKRRTISLAQKNIYKPVSSQREVEAALGRAMEGRLATKLAINSPWDKQERVLIAYPLWKVFHERGWYYITRQVDAKVYYPSRFDRIVSCEVQKSISMNDTHEDDIAEARYLMALGWGMEFPHSREEWNDAQLEQEVIVRFDKEAAAFIKEGINRHKNAKITRAPDGSGGIDFRIRLARYSAFKHWVRSWGSHARFIEPQRFVDEERDEIWRLMVSYGVKSQKT